MTTKTITALAWLLLCGASSAVECCLDKATYAELQSGAVMVFHPKTQEQGLMTSGVFDLRLPNIETQFSGDITWNLGKYARPDAAIHRPCPEPADAEGKGACLLWFGNAYAVGNETVSLIDDDEMAAPHAILFADFGRALQWDEQFNAANPQSLAMDLFTLTACAP